MRWQTYSTVYGCSNTAIAVARIEVGIGVWCMAIAITAAARASTTTTVAASIAQRMNACQHSNHKCSWHCNCVLCFLQHYCITNDQLLMRAETHTTN